MEDRRSQRLVTAALAVNTALLGALVLAYLRSESQLALAQAADSLLDMAAGVILVITTYVGLKPRDEGHPFGHGRAEPLGGLITAVLAGVLAIEVTQSALFAWVRAKSPELDLSVLLVLASKCAVKVLLLLPIGLTLRAGDRSPALRATWVDSRNDVVATLSSLLGFAMARWGLVWADAALALPVALYIGYNGFGLARENLRYLMGESPAKDVLDELRALAAAVPRVEEVSGLRAHFVGSLLHVEVVVLIDPDASATQGHDIGVDVQNAVESHDLVGQAFVHLDTPLGKEHGNGAP